MNFIKQHRQFVILLAIVLAVAAMVYVTAMFRPGIWFDGDFLAQSEDGARFASGDRSLELRKTTDGVRATFTGENGQREYRITTTTRMREIFEDGRLKFRGTIQPVSGGFQFKNERGELVDSSKSAAAQEDFPSAFQVYTWIMEEEHAIRGNPWVLPVMGIFLLALAGNRIWEKKAKPQARRGGKHRPLELLLIAGLVLLLFLGF